MTFIFNQLNLFYSFIHLSLSSLQYSNVDKKQAFKCLLKISLWGEIDYATFYFLLFCT